MRTYKKPIHGYAFKHKTTGDVSLVLFLGTGDDIANYDEITEKEYGKYLIEHERNTDEYMQSVR